ncbi:PHD finger protein ALFIN-LIKE 4-like isoform X1 [Trifolium pratense]|uniref:PHD finger protein ALFIN-LIKE 4-like isoform X1 n=1 Tax=Trifolium pratense TaxID=57577 RepID=UPI001E692895|nr:PHD finger protein ALFIN-LIKE 4-like isoform X1 [Trifolium pratense]
MDGLDLPYDPRTVEEVFRDFKGRRAALIKALTIDIEEFYQQCDPDKENLCLYGFPSEQWAVDLPNEEVPPDLPEPALGINFARDGMQEKDWLSLVAVHSDAWLLSVAFYFGARFGFDKSDRKQLFDMINDLPTIFEDVTGLAKTQRKRKSVSNNSSTKAKSNSKVINDLPTIFEDVTGLAKTQGKKKSVSNNSSTKAKSNSKRGSEPRKKDSKPMAMQTQSNEDDEDGLSADEEDFEEEHEDSSCGACGESYSTDEFWICCDICEKWFHGKCVKITPAKAKHIKQYKCSGCSKRACS